MGRVLPLVQRFTAAASPDHRQSLESAEDVHHGVTRSSSVRASAHPGPSSRPDGSGRVGARIAPLIGADPACVIAADSTTVNLFKTVSAALALRPDRRRIVTETRNFPTDNYIAEGVIRQCGGRHRSMPSSLPRRHGAHATTSRDGAVHDMAGLTRAAHDAGALVIWDLAHSAGVLPLDLAGCDVDFAVGCGYKFLNGGPGAPAPLCGGAPSWRVRACWRRPVRLRPASVTPPVISMVALDAALGLWDKVDLRDVHAKSQALTDFFIELVEARCGGHGLTLVSPRDAAGRGAQVSLSHPTAGYAIVSALIADGVIAALLLVGGDAAPRLAGGPVGPPSRPSLWTGALAPGGGASRRRAVASQPVAGMGAVRRDAAVRRRPAGHAHPDRAPDLASLPRHGAVHQRHPLQPSVLGPAGGQLQLRRHHHGGGAAVRPAAQPSVRSGRAAEPGPPDRLPHRLHRRRAADRRRRVRRRRRGCRHHAAGPDRLRRGDLLLRLRRHHHPSLPTGEHHELCRRRPVVRQPVHPAAGGAGGRHSKPMSARQAGPACCSWRFFRPVLRPSS